MAQPLQRELEVARKLAIVAGAHVLSYHGTALEVDRKAEDEPVTRADREANQILVDGLARDFPNDAILAEETPDDRLRHERDRVWMVDPIDGTRDFIRGREGFAVMIGLFADGRPALGVVYQPIGKRLYFAAQGVGAFEQVEDSRPAAIRTSQIVDPAGIRLVASKSHRTPIIDEVRQRLGIADELNIGSVGLKLGLIARGDRDLYVNPSSKSSLWDTCGPEAILTEAGGKLTDLAGRPLDYRGSDLRHRRGLVASNGPLHEAVLDKLRSLFPEGAPER